MNLKGYKSLNLQEILFQMGGFGVLLFGPAYALLQRGIIDYKSLLLFEASFFANPHLMSTYFRTYTCKAEFERYKPYTLYLLILLIIGLALCINSFGFQFLWILGSVYFYWQWWHHSRQSYGLGRKYQHSKEYQLSPLDSKLNDLVIWSVAILGIALKSNLAGDRYENIPIKVLHLPIDLIVFLLISVLVYIIFYLGRQLHLMLTHKIVQGLFLIHWAIQSFVFICFFGLLPTDIGIIAASFWHCTQYISYTHCHQQRKANSNMLQHPFWKNLFQTDNWMVYLGVLLAFSFLIPAFKVGFGALQLSSLALAFSMGLTFHHYILDGLIWTRKEIEWSLKEAKVACN